MNSKMFIVLGQFKAVTIEDNSTNVNVGRDNNFYVVVGLEHLPIWSYERMYIE